MMDDEQTALFNMIDAFGPLLTTYTGIKQQFINDGWEATHAEQMIIEVIRSANLSTLKALRGIVDE